MLRLVNEVRVRADAIRADWIAVMKSTNETAVRAVYDRSLLAPSLSSVASPHGESAGQQWHADDGAYCLSPTQR